MKKMMMAASAALAAVAMAPAAHATDLDCIALSGSAVCTVDEDGGAFSNSFKGVADFSDTFTFELLAASLVSINGSLIPSSSFASITGEILGQGSFLFQGTDFPTSFLLAAGTYTIAVAGSTTAGGTYSGNVVISAAPVPEPATWAMMVAGIAAVGLTLRRRSAVRVAFS
jgi:hypothetical protein